MAECLLLTLKRMQVLYEAAGVAWPEVLYLQLDGGSENKNRYLLGVLDRYISLEPHPIHNIRHYTTLLLPLTLLANPTPPVSKARGNGAIP